MLTHAFIISRFQSEIGKKFQANYDLQIPSRLISQFGNGYAGVRKIHMTNFAMSKLYNSKTQNFALISLINFKFQTVMIVYK